MIKLLLAALAVASHHASADFSSTPHTELLALSAKKVLELHGFVGCKIDHSKGILRFGVSVILLFIQPQNNVTTPFVRG
jgi:hypothetical protein